MLFFAFRKKNILYIQTRFELVFVHFTDRYFNSVVHQTDGMDRMDTSESQHIQPSNSGGRNTPNSVDGQDNISKSQT